MRMSAAAVDRWAMGMFVSVSGGSGHQVRPEELHAALRTAVRVVATDLRVHGARIRMACRSPPVDRKNRTPTEVLHGDAPWWVV